MIVTADGGWRRGKIVPLKANVDAALKDGDGNVDGVIVLRRSENAVDDEGRPRRLVARRNGQGRPPNAPAEAFDSEHPLFILYTSGSTGKPKGILHTIGGLPAGHVLHDASTSSTCARTTFTGAPPTWAGSRGTRYVVYGPLANGATVFMYEGAPDTPGAGPLVEADRGAQDHDLLHRADGHPRVHQVGRPVAGEGTTFRRLRLLGTVGEPINPEAWMWFREKIGGGRCPIVDTWWQTETGGHMIAPLPGATPDHARHGDACRSSAWTRPSWTTRATRSARTWAASSSSASRGRRCCARSTATTNATRSTYWSEFGDKGFYFTGDGARRDEHGNFWIVGRIDDVLNVAGHRLGTSEIESALVSHPAVAEAAVVGKPDEIKGQGVVAFVTLKGGQTAGKELDDALKKHVGASIGAIARPDEIRFTDALPKTRSGKIMRRLLKEVASGKAVTGDTTTLEDLSILAKLQASED